MKRVITALVGVALLATLTAGSALAASGGVARNQVMTNDYHLMIGANHTWHVVITPCNGSVVATGSQDVYETQEAITASLSADGASITFRSAYVGGWGGSPYSWWGTFLVAGGTFTAYDSAGGVYPGVTVTVEHASVSTWANHGAYVSAMGGGDEAAHSCIGMPLE